MSHDLPGTDPRFHEARKYLTPVVYRGREILASHGACKETGCNYSSAWTSNKARDKGIWTHRAAKVVEARLVYFQKTLGFSAAQSARMLAETADKNSHTYEQWLTLTREFFLKLAGEDLDLSLPEHSYQVRYDLGHNPWDTAREVIDRLSLK